MRLGGERTLRKEKGEKYETWSDQFIFLISFHSFSLLILKRNKKKKEGEEEDQLMVEFKIQLAMHNNNNSSNKRDLKLR